MRVVAEGVETAQQLELLSRHACDEIQGYLLSPAISAEQLECYCADFPQRSKAVS